VKQPLLTFDVVVVGGGHAGVEAAHAASKRGASVGLVTMDVNALARMSCNPAIGGSAKGQIVREIDVLGGLMGAATDHCGVQFKLLNKSKGQAVWSPRAQIDKRKYESFISRQIKDNNLITLVGNEVVEIITENNVLAGCVLRSGQKIITKSLIVTSGTFMDGLIHIGDRKIPAGRMGEPGSVGLTSNLISLGIKTGRLKTGTPPRLKRNSVDWSKTETVLGDDNPTPFSYSTKNFSPTNQPCHTVRTVESTHDLIKKNINLSPMFSGDIGGVGPRYCPSIEDKIHRFSHHPSHLLFLEPEWENSDQIYLNGFSTSLPESVQLGSLRKIPGFEKVDFFRPGYAIEYDFFPPSQLKSTLESKIIPGLFFAGQVNGTSGYEEAAAQGLIAGVNAVSRLRGEASLVFGRDESYIGVLIDDLITKDTLEPYRMFTSRAEHRLSLRYSNADSRLFGFSNRFGLCDSALFAKHNKKQGVFSDTLNLLSKTINSKILTAPGLTDSSMPAIRFIKQPAVTIDSFPRDYFLNIKTPFLEPWERRELFHEAFVSIKYKGYIDRQNVHIQKNKKLEKVFLPKDIDYRSLAGLSNEAVEKLVLIQPETMGQAMRISGVTPSDVSVLFVYLRK